MFNGGSCSGSIYKSLFFRQWFKWSESVLCILMIGTESMETMSHPLSLIGRRVCFFNKRLLCLMSLELGSFMSDRTVQIYKLLTGCIGLSLDRCLSRSIGPIG